MSTLAAVPGGVGVNIGRGGVFLMRPGPDEEKDSSEDRGTWVLSGSIVDGPAWDGVPAAYLRQRGSGCDGVGDRTVPARKRNT